MRLSPVRRTTRLLTLSAAIASMGILPLACDDDDDDADGPVGPPAADVTVNMGDNFFDQPLDTVAVGGTVTWTNVGDNPHTTTSDTGVWDSRTVDPSLDPGESFSFQFTQAGEFPYYCAFHGAPGGVGMAGRIVVR